jgi:hypothetical protein
MNAGRYPLPLSPCLWQPRGKRVLVWLIPQPGGQRFHGARLGLQVAAAKNVGRDGVVVVGGGDARGQAGEPVVEESPQDGLRVACPRLQAVLGQLLDQTLLQFRQALQPFRQSDGEKPFRQEEILDRASLSAVAL